MKNRLTEILSKPTQGVPLSHGDTVYLMSLTDGRSIQRVMAAARRVREQCFGDKVFLYGFIYLSTYCRNHCTFCFYRETNQQSPRYRKSPEEVIEIACRIVESGVHLLDLTLGEDPTIHESAQYPVLYRIIKRLKEKTCASVMVSPGVVPDEVLHGFATAGADWYALYQETHNPVLYARLRPGQRFAERSQKRAEARRAGMLAEDGILLGVGETVLDRAHSILAMRDDGVHQARVMSFVPQAGTPLANRPSPPRTLECLCIAVMRLVMPDRLIPASLDVDGIQGLEMRMEAGANVVTSIIPPSSRLAGVSQSSLDIEQGLRTVPAVNKILSGMGLRPVSAPDYASWVAEKKSTSLGGKGSRDEDRHCGRAASGSGSGVPRAGGWVRDGAH